jgi:small GTP-binding protein
MDEVELKVVLVGDTGVGKTTMMTRWHFGSSAEPAPTIGAMYTHHVHRTADQSVILRVWDTAGAERYRSLMPMYSRFADVVVLVFDVSNEQTLLSIKDAWLGVILQTAPEATRILSGNKTDLEAAVDDAAIAQVVRETGAAAYMPVCGRTGQGIELLFEQVARTPPVPRTADARLAPPAPASNEAHGCCR